MYMDRNIGLATYPDDPRQYDIPRCPVCGSVCKEIVYDKQWGIVGCDECVTHDDAFEVDAEDLDMEDYPLFPEGWTSVCPVCGKECEEYYFDENDEIIGCDECVHIHLSDEEEKCYERQVW